MRAASPAFTLVALLAAAALVFGSGWRLAMRSAETRVPPDRTVLREFASGQQRELLRLEALFQTDLRTLAQETAKADASHARDLCDSLYGIVQFSRLTGNGDRDQHWVIHPDPKVVLPVPVLAGAKPLPNSKATIMLAPEDASPAGDTPDFGWFVPSDPRYWIVWKRIDEKEVDAFLIDRGEIIERVDFYLRQWIQKTLAPVRAAKGLERVETPLGGILAGLDKPPEGRDADMVIPLVCRFGDWQIVAWDRTAKYAFYDIPTLALTSTVAAVLAILGFILFFQQKRATRLAEQRVSFVNRVSHELGAPLTNILLNLDLIDDNHAGLPEPARQRLRLVGEEARRLSRLVCNVLTFSRRERDRLKLSPARHVPDEMIDSVLEQFQPALERRGIGTQWNGAAKKGIAIDGDAFQQIIANLISNVEKYAADGKRLSIESQMENGELIVRVSDRGPGIPRSHATRIFEPFERVDSRVNEGSTGAGLGLSIARELAQLMGGQLRLLESAHGALFEFCLPIGKEDIENPDRG
jgi:signal transduction histidine kinase